jgi:hypothetical protein
MDDQKVIARPAPLIRRFLVRGENSLRCDERIRKESVRALEPRAVERLRQTQARIFDQTPDDCTETLVQTLVSEVSVCNFGC